MSDKLSRGLIAYYFVSGLIITGVADGVHLRRCPADFNKPIQSVQILAMTLAWPAVVIGALIGARTPSDNETVCEP